MGKMKEYLEGQVFITGSQEEVTAWKRNISFNYIGNRYKLVLFWDEFNGFDTYWVQPNKTPDWVINWDESKHEGVSFECYLDGLTYDYENNIFKSSALLDELVESAQRLVELTGGKDENLQDNR